MPIAFTAAGTFAGAENGPNILNNPTSLQFGPDGRLYVSEQNGSINAFTVEKQGDSWVATAAEQLVDGSGNELVKSIQNHNDDGTENGNGNRQVTGLVVAGTATDPILYISSSDPQIASNGEKNLDTNSGVVSRATFNSGTGQWEVVDLVRGLPRSEENHAVNGMILTEGGTKLLLQVGGFTNNGAPSSFFSYTNEYALSGATLELDLVALDALPDQIDPEGGQGDTPRIFKYDLPTLDDPNIANAPDTLSDAEAIALGFREDSEGMDLQGPHGGNDGLNMAILPADAPLRIYADGTRNAYDIAQGANGLIYTVDNGSNGGLGDSPNTEAGDPDNDGITGEAIATPNNGGPGEGEPFHQIVEGGYYYHPNPVRSNQNMSWTVYDNSGNPDASVGTNQVNDISALVPAKLLSDGVITPGFLIDPSKFAVGPGQTLADLTPAEQEERLKLSGVFINSNELDNIADPDGDGSGQTTIAQLGSSTNGIIVYDSGGAAFGGSIDGAVFVTQFNDNVTLLNVNDAGTDLEPIFAEGPDGIFGTADDVLQDADGILQVANNGTGVPLGNPLDVTQGPDGTLWVAEIGSNEITVLAPTVILDPTNEDADFDGILNKDDPFSRDPTNGTSVTITAAAPTVWEFEQGAADTTPGPDGFGGGLTGAMINGETDFEAFYLEENPDDAPNLRLDNVKFVTAADGGTTTVEVVSDGDPFLNDNDGEYLFHTGFVLDEAVETFTVAWSVANPGAVSGGSDITSPFQQIGGYLGDGTQSNYIKIVAIETNSGPKIQIVLEEAVSQGGFPETFDDQVLQTVELDAPGIFDNAALVEDSAITLELLIDLTAKTATPVASYETTSGTVTITGGANDMIDLSPGGQDSKVLQTFEGNTQIALGEEQGIAAGLFSSNTGSAGDDFQAVFKSITVAATEAELPPQAADDSFNTQLDSAITIPVAQLLANDTDPNTGDVLTVTGVSNAANGTVDLVNDVVTFTPDQGFEGTASFDYTVEDSTGNTDTGSVSVEVSDLTVLFRLNAAGDTIAALPDDPYGSDLDWVSAGGMGAQSGTQSGFNWSVTNTNVSTHNIAGRDADVPDYIPQEIYAVERWDPAAAPDMQWTFGSGDLPNGTYTVNILAGNGFGGTSAAGQRVFDITIEDELAFDNVDLSGTYGHQTGAFLSFEVQVNDGTLNVELGRDGTDSVENPTINGIEILQGSIDPVSTNPTIDIVSGNATVNEADGSVQISILASETVPSDETLTFTYVITGVTAVEDSDYAPDESLSGTGAGSVFTGTASIAGGSSDVTLPITVLNDDASEPAETFTVEIVSVSPGYDIGAGLATITIEDDDASSETGVVLYRVNAGGPLVAATDDGPDWGPDAGVFGDAANSPYLADLPTVNTLFSNSSGSSHTGTVETTVGVPTSTPLVVFDTERGDRGAADPTMKWAFDLGTDYGLGEGDQVEVRLYLAEIFNGVDEPGERVFDVAVDGTVPTEFDDIDQVVDAGGVNIGTMRSYIATVDADGILDLDFLNDVENPAIKAIEILAVGTSGSALDTVDGIPVSGGDFSTDPASPSTLLLPAGGSATIVSNLEGGHNDRDFITVTIPDGQRLADIILTDYVADPSNSGFLGLKLGGDFVVDPAIPGPGITPDGVVEPGDLDGGYVFNEGDIGTDLLPNLNAPSFGFAGFDEAALTGDVTVWLNQGGDASQATLTFVTEALPAIGGPIVAAINAGGPALTQGDINFEADTGFLNGSTFADGNGGNGQQPIFDGTVFETERFGGAPGTPQDPLAYEIDVADGDYTVELYFAEIFLPSNGGGDGIGSRVFDVFVEGQLVLDDYDILEETGGDFNQSITFTVPGTFSPGDSGNLTALDIDFVASSDNAKISGIVVREADVEPEAIGAAFLTVNNNSNNIQISNFSNGSFTLTNTGEKDIASFVIDVADALYPDAVFDPFGSAGDTIAKAMTISGGLGGVTGVTEPGAGYYIGAGGILGFEGVALDFDPAVNGGFNPGESIGFAVDMDPNSIAEASKGTLDSGASPAWDIGGISGAELIGSSFTVTFTDGTTAIGKLQGQVNGAGEALQGGSEGLATQGSPGLDVVLTVNGLAEGDAGTYSDGGPTVIVNGPAGSIARVTMTKGIIQPTDNNFPDTADPNEYHDQLDAQLAALAASEFPANNAALFETFDVVLTGEDQDISDLFNFTDVPGIDLSPRDEAQLPLGFVAGIIDPDNDDAPLGPVSSPIHVAYAQAPEADLSVTKMVSDETPDFGDTVTYTVTVTNDGPDAATGVSIEDVLGNGLDLEEASVVASAGSFDDSTGLWTLGGLASGESATLSFDATVLETLPGQNEVVYRINAGADSVIVVGADDSVDASEPDFPNDVPNTSLNGDATTPPGSKPFAPGVTLTGGQEFGNENGAPVIDLSLLPSDTVLTNEVFETERFGVPLRTNTEIFPEQPKMEWDFTVENGNYEVRLYFAELFAMEAEARLFDVEIEGNQVLDDYDIFADVGQNTAVLKAFSTTVNDGNLDIDFTTVVDNAKISAIEILKEGEPITGLDYSSTVEVVTADQADPDSTPGNGVGLGEDDEATVSLAPVAGGINLVTIAAVDAEGAEGDPTDPGQFVVTLEEIAETDTVVSYTVAGTATADGDYTALSGSVIVLAGETSAVIDVTVLDDEELDPDETVEVTLVGATGDANLQLGTDTVATVTISDDEVPPVLGSAKIEITPGGDLGTTTFGGSDKIQITNNGSADIKSISIDFSTGILPDMVWDPTGSGGDETAQVFTAGGTAADVGLVTPGNPGPGVGADDGDPFSQPRNGGWDVVTLNFTDFNQGEFFSFTSDVDPNSIQGIPGAGFSGAVSGYELVGSTITVTFTDGTNDEIVVTSLYEDGSLGGGQAEAVIATDTALATPTIELVGAGSDESDLPGDQHTVPNGETAQIVRVTGEAGANVSLLQMDARLFIASGADPFDVTSSELPFYANEALSGKSLYSAVIGEGGFVDIPVTLLATEVGDGGNDGGLNHFVAVLSELPYAVDTAVSQTSNTLIVREAEPPAGGGTVPEFETIGTESNDNLKGGASEESITGAAGDDTLIGRGGSDLLAGGVGNDLVRGGAGDDVLVYVIGDNVGANDDYRGESGFDRLEIYGTAQELSDPTLAAEIAAYEAFISENANTGVNKGPAFTFASLGLTVFSFEELAVITLGAPLPNDPPVAVDDAATTTQNEAVIVDVLDNDTDANGDPLNVTNVSQGANGGVTINPDGTVTYTPDAGFEGADSFTYTVSDGTDTDTGTVDVTVEVPPPSDPPVAVDDAATTTQNAAVIVDVLDNDTDANGDPLNVTNVSQGANGGVTINPDGTVTYTPDAGFEGVDSFTYTVSDGTDTDTGTVDVTVDPAGTGGSLPVFDETGGPGADDLRGGGGSDSITGAGGNDSVIGRGGSDLLAGGSGDDNVRGSAGDDTLVFVIADNQGATDDYWGNTGVDSLQIYGTANELSDAALVADLAALQDFISDTADPTSNRTDRFEFSSLGLTVNGIEDLEVITYDAIA